MADLAAFLARAGATPVVYGTFDCILWLADWLVEQGLPDPAAGIRGTYSDQAGADAILEPHGGAHGFVAWQAARLGLTWRDTPRAGDVQTIRVPTRSGRARCGAICTGPRWALLTEGGLAVAPAQVVGAWGL